MKKILFFMVIGLIGFVGLSANCIHNAAKKHRKAGVITCKVCSDDDLINHQVKHFDPQGNCMQCGCSRSEHTPNKR